METKPDYFQAAKKAAKSKLPDHSAAHAAAMAKLRELVLNKRELWYEELGWSAVMAARGNY